jgi:hypothetical protein
MLHMSSIYIKLYSVCVFTFCPFLSVRPPTVRVSVRLPCLCVRPSSISYSSAKLECLLSECLRSCGAEIWLTLKTLRMIISSEGT